MVLCVYVRRLVRVLAVWWGFFSYKEGKVIVKFDYFRYTILITEKKVTFLIGCGRTTAAYV